MPATKESVSPTPFVTYRGVKVKRALPLHKSGPHTKERGVNALIDYAKLDGLSATLRKAKTRLERRGQFAPYALVDFVATSRVGRSGELEEGYWEGAAIGQLVEFEGTCELLTWNQHLTRSESSGVAPMNRLNHGNGLAIIGCGAFSQNVVVPALKSAKATIAAVADSSLIRARQLAARIDSAVAYQTPAELLHSAHEFTGIVIACTHSAHAGYAGTALQAGPPVLLEKPAAVAAPALWRLMHIAQDSSAPLRVGHNRRFARDYLTLRDIAQGTDGGVDIQVDVEAFWIPAHHWYHAPGEGNRILGNLTHWLDLAIGLMGDAGPVKIRTTTLAGRGVQVELLFPGPLRASLRLHDVGPRAVGGRESIHIRTPMLSATLEDWSRLRLEDSTTNSVRVRRRDRGHGREYRDWHASVKQGNANADDACRESGPKAQAILEPVRSHITAYAALDQIVREDIGWLSLPSAREWLSGPPPPESFDQG